MLHAHRFLGVFRSIYKVLSNAFGHLGILTRPVSRNSDTMMFCTGRTTNQQPDNLGWLLCRAPSLNRDPPQ